MTDQQQAQVTSQRIGPWVARFEWDTSVARNNPSRVVIEPAPGVDWAELVGGVSTTVLRQVSPVRPAADSPELARAREILAFAAEHYSPSSAEYLAALSLAYANTTDALIPNPSVHLAEVTGRSQNTIKAHLKAARKAGLLTASPHRAGGGITGEAADALQRVIGELNDREDGAARPE